MTFAKAAAAALPFVLLATAALAETKNVPAEKLFPFLKAYYDLQANQRDHFTMGYFLLFDGVDRNSVSLVMKSQAGDRPLNIATNGRVLPLPTAADLKGKREIALTGPKDGKIGIDIRLMPNVAPSASMEASPWPRP